MRSIRSGVSAKASLIRQPLSCRTAQKVRTGRSAFAAVAIASTVVPHFSASEPPVDTGALASAVASVDAAAVAAVVSAAAVVLSLLVLDEQAATNDMVSSAGTTSRDLRMVFVLSEVFGSLGR